MSDKVTVIKKKALKKGMQQYYDSYCVATDLYNSVLYEDAYELIEHTIKYHYTLMKDLQRTFDILEPIEESIDLIGLEKCIFKTRSERLALDNYYALQDLRELYKEVEQQYFTLRTWDSMDKDGVIYD
jgi:hypothetical protein